MTERDKRLIKFAIDNCENIERLTCEAYIKLHPEAKQRIEANRDMFLFATMMVRNEIEKMIEKDEQRTKA